ncbi:MAG TPA: UDP-3-O-acyl-N-acetylglucosamine deacetylase [Gemmatimonadales bacterium]|nr:UDP-3-O-acyl-N-acetylglucosamine deacetylase [Gemmatimonadales bacterium]
MTRRTLAAPVAVRGIGLHTGATTEASFAPAAPGTGIRFRRSDLPEAAPIPATLPNVEATERRTAIGPAPATIHTVEHLLAAVSALELDDVEIALDGPEPPIVDGSFRPFLEALGGAGVKEQEGDATVYTVERPFTLEVGESRYEVRPADAFSMAVSIDFPHPVVGQQAGRWTVTPEQFAGELAGARTFGLIKDVEALRAKGLALGASTENAIALDDTGVVGTKLRWPDEFVRHKAGDLVGDLALLGGRLRAHVEAHRPSHHGNAALARQIWRTARRTGRIAMDIADIMHYLPHRYPFLLVDRILEKEAGKRIVGLKNVTINEPFFQGHFPGHPVMPGVLIIESMAQVGGMLLMDLVPEEQRKQTVVYFMSLDNVKFRRPVLPGDQLRQELEMVQFRGKTCKMSGKAYVDGNLVCEADMMARVVDK